MNEIRVLKRVVILLAAWTSLVLGVFTALDDGASTPAQQPPAAVSDSSEPGTPRPVPSAPARPIASPSPLHQSSSVDDHHPLPPHPPFTPSIPTPDPADPLFPLPVAAAHHHHP